ncbi:hypothetical protein [Candidatus Bandiella euplotis]|uniref:Uncharacterized protein n=1 Tax=Candidatus Bandiella euplotis TaxID=1664265 RepID=A0ABZ0UJ31_9RICK|nr:hypothetical protein [Candidatus Bandiella woodruffii]WPX96083.1 hypothetical protein Bandiella_00186 [Candidatus Bandiella woodruffii]
MPVENIDDFKKQYYRILSDIYVNTNRAKRSEEVYDSNPKVQELSSLIAEAGLDTKGYDIVDGYLVAETNSAIFEFYGCVFNPEEAFGLKQLAGINELDIPDESKKEIKATAFVEAFEMMRNSKDRDEFLHYYGIAKTIKGDFNRAIGEKGNSAAITYLENEALKDEALRANGIMAPSS